jgi:fatty acid amide hydrolase 2
VDDRLIALPATELARLVRERKLSPVELVDAHIERIVTVNPFLNAVVVDRFEEARREAKVYEDIVTKRSAAIPPFFGVPCTIKELIAVRGMPHTAGVVARRAVIAEEDAPLVQRMKAAGCIILGLTNVSEAGLWLETYNRIYGRTNNAHSTRHISGGSTGGEGAIIGSGGSPLGLGADIGGSIRNPCFFNGIFGHKPSGGLLPSTGHWPPAEGERGRYCVSGPMGRSARDLAALMEVMSPAEDPFRDRLRDPFQKVERLRPEEITIHWFDDNGLVDVDSSVRDNVERTVLGLEQVGFKSVRWCPEGMHRAAEIWGAKVSTSDVVSVRELLGNGDPIDLLTEWLRLPLGKSNHFLISLVMATFEFVAKLTPARTEALIALADELYLRIDEKLGPRGVLLCPTYPRPAPLHDAPLFSPFAFSYCGIFNVLEMPSTAVPTGFSDEGLPLGVQIAGRRFDDALTIWVAEKLEEALGPWRPGPKKPYQKR